MKKSKFKEGRFYISEDKSKIIVIKNKHAIIVMDKNLNHVGIQIPIDWIWFPNEWKELKTNEKE